MTPAPGSTSAPLASLVLVVALGGALGSVGRWAAGLLAPDGAGPLWTTLAINVSGSFVLALVPALLAGLTSPRRRVLLAAFLGPGVLGGWTTLSTYAEQSRAALADGAVLTAGLYVAGTLLGCLAAVALARRLGRGPVA